MAFVEPLQLVGEEEEEVYLFASKILVKMVTSFNDRFSRTRTWWVPTAGCRSTKYSIR